MPSSEGPGRNAAGALAMSERNLRGADQQVARRTPGNSAAVGLFLVLDRLTGAQPHLRAGSWETHELEYEADLLAAELLIPDPWLARALKKAENENHPAEIEELARTFQVGRQEMEKRLRQLDLLRGEVLGRM